MISDPWIAPKFGIDKMYWNLNPEGHRPEADIQKVRQPEKYGSKHKLAGKLRLSTEIKNKGMKFRPSI